jgi:hypothetical protein
MTDQLNTPTFFGSSFGPPHVIAADEYLADRN